MLTMNHNFQFLIFFPSFCVLHDVTFDYMTLAIMKQNFHFRAADPEVMGRKQYPALRANRGVEG